MYPSIYNLKKLYEKDDNQEVNYGDIDEETEETILQAPTGNNLKYLPADSVYLIDNGDCIYLYAKNEVSMDMLESIFEI